MAGADANSPISALAHFALTALAVALAWAWLGKPVQLPPSPLAAGGKLSCISYAPFRDGQDPLVPGTMVSAAQIDEDLALLSRYTDCIRTYSNANGLAEIPAIAKRHGLKMLMGLWLANNPPFNRQQIATAIELAKTYPDVISAVVVGNEVLLRGEMSVNELRAILREVKSQVSMPVTYADVWEFWLRYSDLQNDVDFVTIHILPYWEDVPLPAKAAAAHVDDIRKKVAAAIPNKEILIGEIGWPSAGRMREAARPSLSNQARVISETLDLAKRENFRVNVIEAFDQPWKRALEGSTGRYWGIFDRTTQAPKFSFSGLVSDHPDWVKQAAAGIAVAICAFAGAWFFGRGKGAATYLWSRIAVITFLPAVLFGWTLETVPVDSIGIGGWVPDAGLCRRCRRGPGRLRRRQRQRPGSSRLCHAPCRVIGAANRSSRSGAWPGLHCADLAVGRNSARARLRSALSRHSVRAAERRRVCLSGADVLGAAPGRISASRGNARCRHSDGLRHLHRDRRNVRQLAGAMVELWPARARGHPHADAGRARLRIRMPAASADRSALCSTTPKPAAASARDAHRSDGRHRLSRAAPSAVQPKTL